MRNAPRADVVRDVGPRCARADLLRLNPLGARR